MNISGKTMLITGASQGIGQALAVHFAPKVKQLILTARNEANLNETASMVEKAGGKCLVQPSDLCQPNTLERLAEVVQTQAGGADILINNAADLTSKPFMESSFDEIESLMRINVVGALQLTRLIAPMMQARNSGMIINFSSLAGYKANPTQTVYSISKAAVNGMSDGLRAEFKGTGIHVMNVAVCSILHEEPLPPGKMLATDFANRLESAIARDETELYLSLVTKFLMRLYKAFPALMALR